MKKIIVSLIVAGCVFAGLNFIYSNLNTEALSYPITFKFKIPPWWTLEIGPFPVGFLIIVSFCLGILFAALGQALPALWLRFAVRQRERRIKQLEADLARARTTTQVSTEVSRTAE